ncbi:hypothetical protein FRC08_008700 [Ceratobasidium sp. 394]|nr:hypothetical protein FRC08_008700 [Ceratobasidium sp. 394]
MSLRQVLAPCSSRALLRRAHSYPSQSIIARAAYTTGLSTECDTATIRKLSERLPGIIDLAEREKLCTKFWVTLSKAEKKEISDAFEISSEPVRKSASGSPIDFMVSIPYP